jgi:hypothetical protein
MLRGVYPDRRSRVEGLSMTCPGGTEKIADFAQALNEGGLNIVFQKENCYTGNALL